MIKQLLNDAVSLGDISTVSREEDIHAFEEEVWNQESAFREDCQKELHEKTCSSGPPTVHRFPIKRRCFPYQPSALCVRQVLLPGAVQVRHQLRLALVDVPPLRLRAHGRVPAVLPGQDGL